ncbi:phosphodiester glycosidase family protein [Streptomyces sp. TBY4]|uniref:phosphodiester glycosidase family protein n=1 Tax=Streptomyces sp. TBY4 TaxID=2962030 RepID=UPI0020B6705C|nr:phosphodiester glycosidase family protein [Streptomyces sp. TBY4]MCP3759525.1 phosphodiester glycosidase family protein [Streptomyces sp. TBY4]
MKHAVKRGSLALALATSALATPFSAPGASANEVLPASTVLNLADLQAGTPDKSVPGITRTEYTGLPYKGPWKVNVVVIDPNLASLNLKGTFGTGLGTSQQTTSMLGGLTSTPVRKPFVGVNGGFFDGNMKTPGTLTDTWDGDLNGVVIQGGKLLSEAVRGKGGRKFSTSLVLQHGRAYITELSTNLKIAPKGGLDSDEERQLDGINRVPGRSAHCERKDPEDKGVPPEIRDNDTGVCEDLSEIISFTKEYGTTTPTTALLVTPNDPDVPVTPATKQISKDEGFEVELNSAGVVTACYDPNEPVDGSKCKKGNRGGKVIPSGGRILQGIGEGADWLRARTRVDSEFDFTEKVEDTRFGTPLALDPSMYVTAGGDLLLRDGEIQYTDPAEPGRKDPRTAVGTDHYGRTVLVTIDGVDDPDHVVSIGATRGELAAFLKELNVIDAVNMDGGGSTTLVWKQKLANTPTDDNAKERPVGDAVYAGPGGYPME